MTSCASCSSDSTLALLQGRAAALGGALLAFETSGPQGSLALLAPGAARPLVQRFATRALSSEQLLPNLRQALTASQLHPRQLAALAVSCGPGSFTGIRVGMATAAGLQQGLGLRLQPVSSLAALARSCGAPQVLTVLQARQGRVFAALYRNDPEAARPLFSDRLIALAELWAALRPWQRRTAPIVCVGDAAAEAMAVAPPGIAQLCEQAPCACAVLAQAAIGLQPGVPAPAFLPNYLQYSAAEANVAAAQGSSSK
ncbi:MAG: tRNA (adenosine(37)-N6)-threonylcarbamoyltransferase complex dimerization subunit type 1 TsaB [Acetobacteraceae bacterium]|nr:MAG: tRNA (adenosine(37)-N6)-threonylcarbamoyltransferase complex dimerization subunit type 1 TsaB [Acetobacteraceae bacterium]